MKLQVRPLDAAIGAEIEGLDLAAPISRSEREKMLAAWTRHRVLVLRDQQIDDTVHARLAKVFGTPLNFGTPEARDAVIYASGNIDGHGQLLPQGDERETLLKMNWHWHADGCYRDRPNTGVVLRALEVPPAGGETEFADLQGAYVALPHALRSCIDGLTCLHSFACMIEHCGLPAAGAQEILPAATHPLVWRHAGGGRSLFLSPPYMTRIDGLTPEQSRALVEELVAHAEAERYVLRHRWRSHDILVWDNRWMMHRVRPYDLAHERRVMRGATLVGTETVAGNA